LQNILFENRKDAARKLCNVLPLEQMKEEPWVVMATSSGAVPIAYELSNQLSATFDYIFTHKINAPKNDECEIAIITETEEIIIHEELMKSFNIKLEDIYAKASSIYNTKIQDYIKKYRDKKTISNMNGKNILFVDEGLNTGLTMMACIKSAISQGANSVVVAVPILPEVTIMDIESIADNLYFVEAPAHFITISFYYDKLDEISLEEIHNIIKKG